MAINFTAQEIALGKALGFVNVSSQNDKDQILAFARQHGVNNVNSQKDLDSLIPLISKAPPTPVSPGEVANPNDFRPNAPTISFTPPPPPVEAAVAPPIPEAASDGSSSQSAYDALMMQMNAQIQAQQESFAVQQQQAIESAAQQQKQMQEMMAKALQPITVNAPTPAAPASDTPGGGVTFKSAGPENKKKIEDLAMSSSVLTDALTGLGNKVGGTLSQLMIA